MATRFWRFFTAFIVVSAMAAACPRVSCADQATPRVLAMIHNPANVPPAIVVRARDEVVRLFGLIGVDIVWVSHVPPPGTRVRIVSLVTWEPREDRIPPSALGYTLTGPGTRGILAYVFWPRVERASEKFTARLDYVLAVAIAHEIGHMLLPDDSHAKNGLMEANWNRGHFRLASAGLLHFSPETAVLIRQGLASLPEGAALSPSGWSLPAEDNDPTRIATLAQNAAACGICAVDAIARPLRPVSIHTQAPMVVPVRTAVSAAG